MKKNILFVLLVFGITSSAQSTDTLFISKLSDSEWIKFYSNNTKFKTIKFADGTVLQIGDKMKFGKPSGTSQRTLERGGMFDSATQTINYFSFIVLGSMGNAVLSSINYLPALYNGKEIEIKDIKFVKGREAKKGERKYVKHGPKRKIADVMVVFNNPDVDIIVLNLELASQSEELLKN